MAHTKGLTRRAFLGRTAGALAAPTVITSFSLAGEDRPAPSNRITVGMVGVGGEGTKNLHAFLGQPDAQVVAVCEVDPQRMEKAHSAVETKYANDKRSGAFKGCSTTQDFRDILARDDVDAVMISTPDHWHCLISAMALRAGKDVICEKPTLTIQEGRFVADLVKRYGAVFQTSTEDRSLAMYHRMAELVRNGRIGKLQRIYVKLPGGPDNPGDATPQPVPPGFNYEMWLGPAAWAPYTPARIHWNFRWIWDYSGGVLTDWGAHLIDTAQWGNDTERTGPVEVEGTGKRHTTGLYNTFYEYHLCYKYASGVEMFIDSGGAALKFEGTAGWVGNDGWTAPLQASSPQILKSVIGPGEIHLFTCPGGEHRNFLDCVKTRTDPYFPAEIGHRCSSVMHIGNIAMLTGRKLRWDPAAEHFVDDPGPDRLRARAMRAPWRL
ncbi:MAG: Gfo/Idh/MocA family oxidoreductase [Planctomycetota bacterium]